MSRRAHAEAWLAAPVDGASLAFVRLGLGAALTLEALADFRQGWPWRDFLVPKVSFPFGGFAWVEPWPAPGMQVHLASLAVLGLGIMIGWRARLCSALFGVGLLYLFVLEKARYLNHFYLVMLLCGLFALLPASTTLSVAAVRARRRSQTPVRHVPRWTVELLRVQLGLVYLHAGLAKLNVDWLRGEPLRSWFAGRADLPLVGPWLTHELTPWLFSYGGLAFDLCIWPLLIWRRTRVLGFVLVAGFHLTNAALFDIGIFPWVMLVCTTIFAAPEWPRRLFPRWFAGPLPGAPAPPPGPAWTPRAGRLAVLGLVTYVGFQALFPLRHLLYPGSVHWTEEGHAFSWHMKLRSKRGEASFSVRDPVSGQQWLVDPRQDLIEMQLRKLCGRPDMVLTYAHYLAAEWQRRGHEQVEVRASVRTSLNRRPAHWLVDPEVDLAAERWSWWRPSAWVTRLPEGDTDDERARPR